jgi:CheY-like chemotaxis protein
VQFLGEMSDKVNKLTQCILLVDDDAQDVQLTQIALEKANKEIAVDIARDGDEAVDYLFRRGKFVGASEPSLVLLDLKMPRLNGFDVLRIAKSDDKIRVVPIIVYTSSKIASDVNLSYQLGANAYVEKPLAFDQAFKSLQSLCDFWLRTNYRIVERAI